MSEHHMQPMIGQPVIAIDTAEEIGDVKHFVVSTDVSRVERLHIDGRKKNALFAEWASLESFGADRVMVTAADDPSESDDDRDLDAAKGNVELLGARVLDTAGFEHGTVSDAIFDADTGSIIAIITSEQVRVEQSHVHSLGSYAVVVADT